MTNNIYFYLLESTFMDGKTNINKIENHLSYK